MSSTPKFYNNLNLINHEIWRLLCDGVRDRKSFFHTPSLGTIRKGKVKIRTLVLREANKKKLLLRFHSDIRSKKIEDIKKDQKVLIHGYNPLNKIQLQIQGNAKINHHSSLTKTIWSKMDTSSKACYRLKNMPGYKIHSLKDSTYPESNDPEEGYENFSLIFVQVSQIEWLFLSSKGHRRAIFEYSRLNINSKWIAP